MKRLDEYWYRRNPLSLVLLPVSWLFCMLVYIRKHLYQKGMLKTVRMPVPVIIVGNISVGGSGKTPLVVAIFSLLKNAGYKPGIISRGYGGLAKTWPQQVREDSDPRMVGDEPVLMARYCGTAMAVGPDRVSAAQQLLKYHDCDVIISDDGLQHYVLERDIEIAVVDGVRRFGNGHCLPAGPLRERKSRLEEVDFIVTNGIAMRMEYPMELESNEAVNLMTGERRNMGVFSGSVVHAIAGIGNPDRFFSDLEKYGLVFTRHPFPDHYDYKADDLLFDDDSLIFMTEKDAVKCKKYARDDIWYVPVKANLDKRLVTRLLYMLKKQYDESYSIN
ncbi:MAG TPA: tetraacyldisaccharide 4'-kinase [Gammaproteobacteria bacterium]|nr:tetraacyldisaccharide 4'-kinase [Gammaproteobacteria bacterium]